MADDKMIFPIGFDLEKAVEEASNDWDKYAKKLEKALETRPVKIKIGFDLDKKLDTLDDVKKKLSELKIEPITPENKTALSELIRELKELAKIMEKVSSLKGVELPELQAAKAAKMRKEVEQADAKLAMQQERTRQAQERLILAQKRAENQARRTSQAYHEQDGYISRLLKRMAVYAAYSGVNTFLTSVREVTAQFELQRISLGAIIQDQQRANQLFNEIKAFALTSPLKILDLTKYTKQVAAYGFQADKLFQTTKMLADISVGLGADMSRATLFLGQVYATGYLRAAELRQATELGIPLVDKLAKKLEELNGRVYSAADVMDLISKRAISFEMVESVFQDMTSAGGEFYNMQVKQSQTLFGMWAKLGDAAAIMYDQIGNTQGVNEGMKTLIHSLELLMRNWKDTARVIDVAVGSMVVYAVGLKNAAISTNALSGATALLNLAHKQQVIQTPKIVAAIVGQNVATKLSTTLTSLHTKAVLRHAVATNVLTQGFWKLTAAMLANPWVAAAAAITAVGLALFHFIGNTETAAERMEALNNSVASLKNLDDTITPMIDTYNELINKTERTAEEEKKLSEVTHELAKRYPGAVKSIGDFGNEVDLVADKLNELYKAEKQARMDNTRYELDKTEKKIEETKGKIQQLQEKIAGGEKVVTVGGGISGYTQTISVEMSDEEKGKLIVQLTDLRVELAELENGANAARDALEAMTKGITIDELHIEKFGAWKKTLTTFRQQVGDVRVQLFDDSTINQFGSLEEALKKTAEEYKKNIALVNTYDDVLKSTTLSAEERAKIETERAEADVMATLAENALKYFNALSLLDTKSGGGRSNKSDPRLQTLQEIANKMAEVNKEYDELLKKEGQTKALADTQKRFASSFKQMQETAKKYKFKLPTFEVPQTIEDVQKWYKAIQKEIQRLGLKNADKVLIELGFKSDKAAIDKQQKDIEGQLKELSDRISRTKTAKEFYEKILAQTGDIELAKSVSLSIYGDDGAKLFEQTVEQIREVFKSGNANVVIDVSPAIDTTNQSINYKMLADIYDKYQNDIIEKNRDTAQKIVSEGQKTAASNIINWQKELAKAKSYEEKRTDIINRETQRRAQIIKSDIKPEEKQQLISLSYEKQGQDLAKNAVDEFKSSDDYIKVFQDLDRVSTATLDRMKKRLEEMIATVKDTENVEGLKSLVEQLDKINEERDTRNPVEGVINSFKEYAKARKDFHIAEAKEAEVKAAYAKEKLSLDTAVQTAEGERAMAQAKVAQFEEQGLLHTKEGKAATLELNEAEKKVTQAVENRNKAVKKVNNAEQETTDALDQQKSALVKLQKNVNAMANAFSSAASSIQTIADMMGLAEDSELGDLVEGLVSGLNNAATIMTTILAIAIAIESACWWLMAIGAAVSVFSAIGSWFTGSKVRKANKEIGRQQEILDRLEYTYERLEKAADKLFGRDYINNYNARLRALQSQQSAYMAQAQAERSKGKDADKDKINEYEQSARKAADSIRDLQSDLTQKFMGAERTDVAREFAESWLDAKATFASTTDAMKSKYKDMVKSMVVEGAAAKVIDNLLTPMWDKMNALLKKSDIQGATDYLATNLNTFMTAANNGLNTLWSTLQSRGYDLRELLSDENSSFSGIARDIASASEESINGLAAGINTQNFYISQIHANVASIARNATYDSAKLPDYTTMIQQSLENQSMMVRYQAETLAECRNIAAKCQAQTDLISRVIAPRQTSTSNYVVATKLMK